MVVPRAKNLRHQRGQRLAVPATFDELGRRPQIADDPPNREGPPGSGPPDSTHFADCVTQTVNQGGDADTTGALAAMLAGATYGMPAIPLSWLVKLDHKVAAEIREQVPKLLAIAARPVLAEPRPTS